MLQRLNELCKNYRLGTIISEPAPVSGGLLHKMYHVLTDRGEYAIKWLNPDIMKRPDAYRNMVNSERIANCLRHSLPAIAAKKIKGNYVLKVKENYYLVYDWLEGRSIFPPDITASHCKTIGQLTGLIHSLNLSVPGIEPEVKTPEIYDWEKYLDMAKFQKSFWLDEYQDSLEKIQFWNRAVIASSDLLSDNTVISHRDLDPKNIMWQNNEAFIIDWEAAGIVNPNKEFLELIHYWCTECDGTLSREKFNALQNGYYVHMKKVSVDWSSVLDNGYDGMLGWLNYCIGLALGLENPDQQVIDHGASQIISTIASLKQYEAQTLILERWLNE